MARSTRNRTNPVNSVTGSLDPMVEGEYMDMVMEYKRDERRKRKLQSPGDDVGTKRASGKPFDVDTPVASTSQPEQNSDKNLLPSTSHVEVHSESDEDSDEDSDEFEDVELDVEDADYSHNDSDAGHQGVTISLDASQARHVTRKRSEPGIPRPTRIAIHKVALIVWMVHTRTRYQWLSSREVRNNSVLRNVFTHRVMEQLYPPEHLTDFLKSKRLISGIRAALEEWRLKFKVIRSSLASREDVRGDPGSRREYLNDLFNLRGSADMLGQGFLGVMLSLGFRARLVCSLQPPDNLGSTVASSRKTTKSESPIFWTEIWDQWAPGWISVDPLTDTVRMPLGSRTSTAIEPKASDHLNIMRYCVAWERGRARDVTRRYTSSFNARTRKKRLPHYEKEEWLDRLFAYFGPRKYTRQDIAEIRKLVNYSRKEGIPTRVQDFVGHPFYALGDKLHHNEILKPGAVPCGTLANKGKQIIYIYERKDVLTALSSQSWYRKGRTIKPGAQAVLRRETTNRLTGEPESVGLYTFDQTELYEAPPVEPDGEVPKSQYRTIDIFTENMIPAGAVYIRDPHGVEAAKLLRIDYANAVTAIEFGKRGPQSKMNGVVIAETNNPAMQLVLQGLKEQRLEDAARREDARILALWRQYMVGIQIWDRVERMNPQTDKGDEETEGPGADELDDSSSDSSDNGNGSSSGGTQSPSVSEKNEIRADDRESERKGSLDHEEESGLRHKLKNTVRVDDYGSDISHEGRPHSAQQPSVHSHSPTRFQNQGGNSDVDTHSSFSDLDVDDISESELNG